MLLKLNVFICFSFDLKNLNLMLHLKNNYQIFLIKLKNYKSTFKQQKYNYELNF